mmetsp:Transcript_40847/g.94687  ORF Transcript_40847/g.94687 Transcript_40847/m.94687 type:complete len:202 (+) Transcript_40847:361-966(+)
MDASSFPPKRFAVAEGSLAPGGLLQLAQWHVKGLRGALPERFWWRGSLCFGPSEACRGSAELRPSFPSPRPSSLYPPASSPRRPASVPEAGLPLRSCPVPAPLFAALAPRACVLPIAPLSPFVTSRRCVAAPPGAGPPPRPWHPQASCCPKRSSQTKGPPPPRQRTCPPQLRALQPLRLCSHGHLLGTSGRPRLEPLAMPR